MWLAMLICSCSGFTQSLWSPSLPAHPTPPLPPSPLPPFPQPASESVQQCFPTAAQGTCLPKSTDYPSCVWCPRGGGGGVPCMAFSFPMQVPLGTACSAGSGIWAGLVTLLWFDRQTLIMGLCCLKTCSDRAPLPPPPPPPPPIQHSARQSRAYAI